MSWLQKGAKVRIADIKPGTKFKWRGKFYVKIDQSEMTCIALDGFWIRNMRAWRYGEVVGQYDQDGEFVEVSE